LIYQDKKPVKVSLVPEEENGSAVLFSSTSPSTGKKAVRFRKGEKNEKDIFVEIWDAKKGIVFSKKVSDKVTKIYNDAIFG